MPLTCCAAGCKAAVPAELEPERVCVLHFSLSVEDACAAMRRETALGMAKHERQVEIIHYISEQAQMLARVATSGLRLGAEVKARVLSTLLTLMNLRENLDRAVGRQSSRP